jgi:hypothetical protein
VTPIGNINYYGCWHHFYLEYGSCILCLERRVGESMPGHMEEVGTEYKKPMPPSTQHQPTLRGLFTYILGRLAKDQSAPLWPPDLFGLCMTALQQTGSYCIVLRNWPPVRDGISRKSLEWAEYVERIGRTWISSWPNLLVPTEVDGLWQTVIKGWDIDLASVAKDLVLGQALLELCSIADEACADMGTIGPPYDLANDSTDAAELDKLDDLFHYVDTVLKPTEAGSTLCKEIHAGVQRVLPKMRTPQAGLTIRSLSHHLSLCSGNEMKPRWILIGYPQPEPGLNLLLIPWPSRVKPVQFEVAEPPPEEMRNMSEDDFGFFSFSHAHESGDVTKLVSSVYAKAVDTMGRIDGVILPELALTTEQYESISKNVLSKNSFLISGVGSSSVRGKAPGKNYIRVDFPRLPPITQSKHHRWKLDRNQISQYGLGTRLDPEKMWWEHIEIGNRELVFLSISEWLVTSVLLCEDLARPDPVGDLVRAVGPNLVIALLMDLN